MSAALQWILSRFTPDHARYEGVRPIHVYLLRLFYTLMFVFVGMDSWTYILGHEGPWDVAYPLWSTGQLAGSPAAGMANIFMWMPVTLLVVPWGYAFRTFVLGRPAPQRA